MGFEKRNDFILKQFENMKLKLDQTHTCIIKG